MKKLIYCAAALATALFAGSCQRELLDPAAQGGSTVTYTVNVPEVATKAIGDGSMVDQLVYAVYRIKDNETNEKTAKEGIANPDVCQFVYQKTLSVAGKTRAIVPLEFINNQRYIVLFWAQNTNAWFDVTKHNLGSSDIAYPDDYQPNNDKYDAFTNVDYIAVNGADSRDIKLTRPFGQLNIATNLPSTFTAEVNRTKVSVMGLAHSYNVATKKGTVTVDPAAPAAPVAPVAFVEAAPLMHDAQNYLAFGNYARYISMNYVFVEDEQANVAVTYEIETSHGKVSNTINSVPVKKNYKTNIVGSLLTSNVDYNVTLEKGWETPSEEIVLVNTASGLQDAVDNAVPGVETEIKLDGNIDLNDLSALLATPVTLSTKAASAPSSLIIPSEKKVILNLNGYTLTQTVDYAGHSMIVNNGNLTLKGEGTICYTYNGTPDTSNSKGNQTISNFGTLVLDGPTVENATAQMSHARFAIDTREGAICNIISGVVRCPNSMAIRMGQFGPDANVLNITGGHIYGARAVQVHLPSSSATVNPVMTLNVQGGLLESNDEQYNIGIYVISNGQSAENVAVTVGGEAQIKGNVYVNAAATNTMKSKAVKITGGAITGEVYSYSDDQEKADDVISVTGGTFDAEPNYVDDAYECKEQDGKYVVVKKPDVAKIGETGYWSLNAAVADVQDGQTITLVTNETFTAKNRTHNSGSYYDGLYYVGDKSFTIDLGGFTVQQDGAVNDYLLNFKNDGAKANVITLKNGTVDAGTAAFCALCTSETSTQELTINLEGVNLINNMSNGSTLKIRGAKTTLNVKSDTKITGQDSYLGIECSASTVNIFDGAEIYMNGTTSYNGCLVGVGGNGTVNVYGGYGKGVRGGFIAMTSGGVINVEGGEWIANTDGTVGDNSNLYVLTAQNNKHENGYVGASIINVTGGTFRGGMDAWVLNDANVEKAELNISGGNFNADPDRYRAEGCFVQENENGTYEVYNGTAVSTEDELTAALKAKAAKIYVTANMTISKKWDNRYNGAKTSLPIEIDGLGHTLKFTNIDDAANRGAVFYFTEDALVKNLKIDVSEATYNFMVRAITAAKNLTLQKCTFIGNLNHTRNNAVVVGDCGDSTPMWPYEVTITDCIFKDWRRAISDNENSKSEIQNVNIQNNVFTSAPVNVSAHNNINFCNNVTDSDVRLTSYTNAANTKVKAIGNTLNTSKVNWIGAGTKYFSSANVEAQSEFTVTTLE